MDDLNKNNVGTWDPEDRGEIEWNDSFNLAPIANQNFILSVCNKLKNKSFVIDR